MPAEERRGLPAEAQRGNVFYVSGRAPEDLSAEQAELESRRVATYVLLNSAVITLWYSSKFTVLIMYPRGTAGQGEFMRNLPAADVVMTGWTWEQHTELTPMLEAVVTNPNLSKLRRNDVLPDLGPGFAGLDVNTYLQRDATHTRGYPAGEHVCVWLLKPKLAITYKVRAGVQQLLSTMRAHVTWTGYGFRVACSSHQHAAIVQQALDRSAKTRQQWALSWLRPPTPPQQDTTARRLNVTFSGAADLNSAILEIRALEPLEGKQLCFTAVVFFGATAAMATGCGLIIVAFVGPNSHEAASRFEAYHDLSGVVTSLPSSALASHRGIWFAANRLPRLQSATSVSNPCLEPYLARLNAGDTLAWYTPLALIGHRDDFWMKACWALLNGTATAVLACEMGLLAVIPRGSPGTVLTGWTVYSINMAGERPPPLRITPPPCNYWVLYADDAVIVPAEDVYGALMERNQPDEALGPRAQQQP